MKVCFETFGCRLNRAEALREEAVYAARGWSATASHADADLIVVRGCSVTQRAQRDCERLIAHIRRKYPFKRLIVTGCLKTADRSYTLRTAQERRKTSAPAAPPVPTRTARAYLKVQDGCSGSCAFCIVPKFRGSARSVPFADCLAEARRFIDAGYHEIVVTGCNLSMYVSEGKRLPDLLDALAGLSPHCRIRLGSLEPSSVALDTVKVVAAHANICNFLHIPVQSGSNRILSAMRRPYQVKLVEELTRTAASLMPDLGLGCDLMTGFPDETDNDFLATKATFRRLGFNNAHVFPFSERPDTLAAKLPGVVPGEVRSARAHELADLARAERSRFAKKFKGRTVEVIVEDESRLAGWTAEYLWCQVGADKAKVLTRTDRGPEKALRRKDLIRVLVREVRDHVLTGDPV